jgi:hypothetical protein
LLEDIVKLDWWTPVKLNVFVSELQQFMRLRHLKLCADRSWTFPRHLLRTHSVTRSRVAPVIAAISPANAAVSMSVSFASATKRPAGA